MTTVSEPTPPSQAVSRGRPPAYKPEPEDGLVDFVRYGNRKLYTYATTPGRYVTLGEVVLLVKRGVRIRVIDAATGRDRTDLTISKALVAAQERAQHEVDSGKLTDLVQGSLPRLRGAKVKRYGNALRVRPRRRP